MKQAVVGCQSNIMRMHVFPKMHQHTDAYERVDNNANQSGTRWCPCASQPHTDNSSCGAGQQPACHVAWRCLAPTTSSKYIAKLAGFTQQDNKLAAPWETEAHTSHLSVVSNCCSLRCINHSPYKCWIVTHTVSHAGSAAPITNSAARHWSSAKGLSNT